MLTATFFRRLLPLVLLGSFALASCEGGKDRDPRPRGSGKCNKTAPTTTTPPAGGNS